MLLHVVYVVIVPPVTRLQCQNFGHVQLLQQHHAVMGHSLQLHMRSTLCQSLLCAIYLSQEVSLKAKADVDAAFSWRDGRQYAVIHCMSTQPLGVTSMLVASASSGAAREAVSGACPGVCRACLPGFFLGEGLSAGAMRCARDGGAVTQFASVASAGCITYAVRPSQETCTRGAQNS